MNAAEDKAQELLKDFGVFGPPIPVEALAQHVGAEVRYRRFDNDVSGVLLREGDSKFIGVNVEHPKTRKRFTIAHEIGHLLLHPGDRVRSWNTCRHE